MVSLRSLGLILIIIGAILEFIEIKIMLKSKRVYIRFRRNITVYLSGTLFAIAGVLLILS